MERFGWPLIIGIVVGVVSTVVGGLALEVSKQFIPQMEEAEKAKIRGTIKLTIRSIQGVLIGAALGAFVASAFFSESLYRTIPMADGPLTAGAPILPSEPLQVPTGETKLTETGTLVIVVFGFAGGFVGYYSEQSRAGLAGKKNA